ncbi:MAG: GNAT family N-acetyltransferase [Lutispora sp.]|nr:GNAT family N-acetyltransferase [Lutispora sp.]
MNPNYIIKDYEESNWQGVSGLFKDVFGKDIDPQYFKWKNIDNPQGKSIVKIAVSGDKTIGLSSIWNFRVNFFGESISAGQSVDAMVDKNYRKMSIFENMAMEAIEDMKKEDIQLRFNFPNEAAYLASINKINIKRVCDIPQYIKILKGREAAGMFTGNKVVKLVGGILLGLYRKAKTISIKKAHKYDVREIEWFDQSLDAYWDKVKKDYPIAVERSSKYLNWRYLSSPNKYKAFAAYSNNEIIGYIIAAMEEKTGKSGENILLGHIVDLMCSKDHKDASIELITEAERYLKANGACAISCWMIKEWFYSEILSKWAYLQLRSPSVLAVLPVGETVKAVGDFVYDNKNWYITIGDSDYI